MCSLDRSLSLNLCHRTLLLRLLKFIVMITLCTHFVACIWYMLGCQADRCQRNTWALTASLVDSSASDADHYCNSLYWAVATMTTTGYGDISATNVQVNIITKSVSHYVGDRA